MFDKILNTGLLRCITNIESDSINNSNEKIRNPKKVLYTK